MKNIVIFFVVFVSTVFSLPYVGVFDPLNEGFTQELWGHGRCFNNIFVGVGFDANGEVLTVDCDGSQGYRFATTTVLEHGTQVHPATRVTFASNLGGVLGCSLINHPDGFLYYGTYSHGILKLDPLTLQSIPLPARSQNVRLGMSVDPQNPNHIYYIDYPSSRTLRRYDVTTGADIVFVFVAISAFIDGIYWNEDGSVLYCADLSGNKVIGVNRDGTIAGTYSAPNPDGIAFHISSKTIFTNNSPGTITRIDPVAGTSTTFASGGFRGDMGAVGGDGCWYITQNGVRFDDGFTVAQPENSIVRICSGFAIPPGVDPVCNETGTYHTQSEGDWGDSCSEGFETGCYRDDNFDECFPDGLTVGCVCEPSKRTSSGCGYSIHLDSSSAVENFLPQLGAPGVLDQDYFNPSNPPPMSTSSGNFGGQVTALALSLGFEECDPDFHTDCGKLKDLYICDDRCSKCKRNGNCKRNNNDCRFLREFEEGESDLELRTNKNQNFNNNNNGKPKYANCEEFYGWTVGDIFNAANEVLGGCGHCSVAKRLEIEERNNNPHCSRNSECRRSKQSRNNNHCNRNSDCKRNNNCCCCEHQPDPECDPKLLNACVTLINQAFIFGKKLDDVQSGTLFTEESCPEK